MKTHYRKLAKTFPTHHPMAGQPTFFEEKILGNGKKHTIRLINKDSKRPPIQVGDLLQLEEWTGKPYASKVKKIMRLPVVKIYDFDLEPLGGNYLLNGHPLNLKQLEIIAHNDGFLEVDDFELWFGDVKEFRAQILCWDESIDYMKQLFNL